MTGRNARARARERNGAVVTPPVAEPAAKRGRKPLDPTGAPSVEVRVTLTRAQADRAAEIAREEGLVEPVTGRPIVSAAVRLLIDRA